MIRAILAFLLSGVALVADAAWPDVEFSEVRAYSWPTVHHELDDTGAAHVILPGIIIRPDVINKQGAPLTSEQVVRLLAAAAAKIPPHDIRPMHYPHNAFVFYNTAKKPVAFIEVSFCRLRHTAAPKGISMRPDLLAFATLFDELKLPMGEFADLAAYKKFHRDQ
ncbi:MAG: hypothetical protein V4710_07580 [Verrucomicrobiota bacterium]